MNAGYRGIIIWVWQRVNSILLHVLTVFGFKTSVAQTVTNTITNPSGGVNAQFSPSSVLSFC